MDEMVVACPKWKGPERRGILASPFRCAGATAFLIVEEITETMNPPPSARAEGAPSGPRKGLKAARGIARVAVLVFITFCFGWVLNKSVVSSNENPRPAGFGRGMLHGALMPGAMPTLLVGKDVVIYAENNTGRTYKLGYTFGVNACGALFFGSFYWRLTRWKRRYGNRT